MDAITLEIECPFEHCICVAETSQERMGSFLLNILVTRWRSVSIWQREEDEIATLPTLTEQPKQVISTSRVRRPNVEPWLAWPLSPLGRLCMRWIVARRHCSGIPESMSN